MESGTKWGGYAASAAGSGARLRLGYQRRKSPAIRHKDGRRNRYQIQAHLLLPGPASQQPAIGGLLDLLTSQRETTEHS